MRPLRTGEEAQPCHSGQPPRLMDTVVGIDMHAVAPIPGIPIHPYFGPIYLWTNPKFPMSDVLHQQHAGLHGGCDGLLRPRPSGRARHTHAPNCPYWKRYLTNVAMGLVLMGLTTLANIAIAGHRRVHSQDEGCRELHQGRDRDRHVLDTASTWESIKGSFSSLVQWPTWVKLLMPPLPYPGAQGSTAVGSPNVTVNGGPLAFVAPLVATSCSDIPVVPNAMTIGLATCWWE